MRRVIGKRKPVRWLAAALLVSGMLVTAGCESTHVGVGVSVSYPGPYGRVRGPWGGGGIWVGGPIYGPF